MTPPWEVKDSRLPGPVLDDESGYAWPTWREALLDAHQGIATAQRRRRDVFQAAYDAGLTFRQIGEAAGLSPASVHKIIGGQRHRVALDDDAYNAREGRS